MSDTKKRTKNESDDANLRMMSPDSPAIADSLWYQDYADALAEVVSNPENRQLVIGIQGDWGVWKTSFLRLVERKLSKGSSSKEEAKPPVLFVNFNSWQFANETNLGFALLTHFLLVIKDEFRKSETRPENFISRFAKSKNVDTGKIMELGKKMLKGLTLGIEWGGFKAEYDFSKLFDDEAVTVGAVREMFSKLVDETKKEVGNDDLKFVIAIDDLDRINPVKAIEILDFIKNFLSVDGCVFLVACDREIIKKGITLKYSSMLWGIETQEHREFRKKMEQEYVEKIIQLSFNIPKLTANDFGKYFDECFPNLLQNETKAARIGYLKSVLEGVTNLNPRRMKLLGNEYRLNAAILDKKNVKATTLGILASTLFSTNSAKAEAKGSPVSSKDADSYEYAGQIRQSLLALRSSSYGSIPADAIDGFDEKDAWKLLLLDIEKDKDALANMKKCLEHIPADVEKDIYAELKSACEDFLADCEQEEWLSVLWKCQDEEWRNVNVRFTLVKMGRGRGGDDSVYKLETYLHQPGQWKKEKLDYTGLSFLGLEIWPKSGITKKLLKSKLEEAFSTAASISQAEKTRLPKEDAKNNEAFLARFRRG